MWLEITDINKNSKIIIGAIYRHPNQNFLEFKDKLENSLDKISSQSLPCIIAGDMNIDLVKSAGHSGTSQYIENLLINNFMRTILMPTRFLRHSTCKYTLTLKPELGSSRSSKMIPFNPAPMTSY